MWYSTIKLALYSELLSGPCGEQREQQIFTWEKLEAATFLIDFLSTYRLIHWYLQNHSNETETKQKLLFLLLSNNVFGPLVSWEGIVWHYCKWAGFISTAAHLNKIYALYICNTLDSSSPSWLRSGLYNEFNLWDSSSCLISRLSLTACIYLLPSKNDWWKNCAVRFSPTGCYTKQTSQVCSRVIITPFIVLICCLRNTADLFLPSSA